VTDIPQPAGVKNAKDEVNSIHTPLIWLKGTGQMLDYQIFKGTGQMLDYQIFWIFKLCI